MHGLVYLSASSGLPTTGLVINGDLCVVQKQPLAHRGLDRRFAVPMFNKSSIFADAFNFKKIIYDYSQRNVSVRMSNDYMMWERGVTGLGNPFVINLHMNYPVQTLTYYAGFWQVCRFLYCFSYLNYNGTNISRSFLIFKKIGATDRKYSNQGVKLNLQKTGLATF